MLPSGKYYVVNNWLADCDKIPGVEVSSFDSINDIHLHNGSFWLLYRLGDAFEGIHVEGDFPDTILHELRKTCKGMNRDKKLVALNEIISNRYLHNHSWDDILYVGLRIGDIYGNRSNRLNDYQYSPGDYRNMEMDVNEKTIVVLCCGSHFNPNYVKTKTYLKAVYEVFLEKGFKKIIFRIGNSPDDDFVLLSTAKNLIPGKGNFHKLIHDMNKLRNNKE